MAGYNPNRPRRNTPNQVPGLHVPETEAEAQPEPIKPQPGRAPIGYDDPPPAPATRVLPRHGIPDRIMLFAGSITAAVVLLVVIVTFAWWRRHRIAIYRISDSVSSSVSGNASDSVSSNGNAGTH